VNYFKKTLSGFMWISALSGSIRLLAFVKIAILARLLLPNQFGEFAVITMVIALVEMLTETGINVFLLQEKDSLAKFINTAWVVSIFRGVVISAVIVVAAYPVAIFFHIPTARNLLLVASLIPLIRGLINPASIKWQKELLFAKEFGYRLSIVAVEIALTVVLVLRFPSAASLVLGMAGAAIGEVVASWLFITPRPKAKLDWEQVKTIVQRGKWVTGFGLFDYIFTTADNVVVGRMLGSSALGIYQNAYKLALLPGTQANDIYYKTTTPVYVKLLDERRSVAKAILVGTSGLVGIQVVIGVAIFALADWLVRVILGPNWLAAIPAVRTLALLSVIRGIALSPNSLLVALKQQHYVTWVTLVAMAGLITTIVPAVARWGIVGAAYSAVFGAALSLPVALFFLRKVVQSI